jgi:hypothetical protein
MLFDACTFEQVEYRNIHRTIADIGLLGDTSFDADTTPGCE